MRFTQLDEQLQKSYEGNFVPPIVAAIGAIVNKRPSRRILTELQALKASLPDPAAESVL